MTEKGKVLYIAMEITNNYSNYATNYADTAKKADSKAATEVKTNSKDKVQEYYEKLCKKFPQINFNTNGGVLPSNSSKVTVNLSYDCLKKMANDPEFAKEIEWNLSGEVAANSMVYGWVQRDGVVLGGRTVTYDANGNRQSSCGGMRTANAGDSNTNKMQKKYKAEEERWLKARKKREKKEKIAKKQAEKKAEEKRMAERRAEKKAAEEARTETGEYTVSATGTDIKAVTEKVIAATSGTSAPTGVLYLSYLAEVLKQVLLRIAGLNIRGGAKAVLNDRRTANKY